MRKRWPVSFSMVIRRVVVFVVEGVEDCPGAEGVSGTGGRSVYDSNGESVMFTSWRLNV